MIQNIEQKLEYYKRLNELQRRQYLGLLAQDLGRSGVRQVSKAFGVNAHTVRKGKKEVANLQSAPISSDRVRRAGGGRKKS
jgi:hypothetical protein